jgi:hypothetical protein
MTAWEIALVGALAGVLGAVVLTPLVWLSRRLLGAAERPRDPFAPGSILSEAGSVPPDLLQVTAVFVQKVATGLFGRSLPPHHQRVLGTLWHLAYGGGWGVAYAVVQTAFEVPAVVQGVGFGVLVWVVGPAWLVPRMRLIDPLGHAPGTVSALVVGWHLAFGVVVAAVVEALGG